MRRAVGAIASLSLLTVGIALVAAGARNEAAATGATSGTGRGQGLPRLQRQWCV